MQWISRSIRFCLEQLFPPYCCYCRQDGSLLCDACYEEIIFLSLPIKIKLESTFIDQIIAAAQYSPIIKGLLVSMKYKHVKNVGVLCGRLLYHTVAIPKCDYITAVPMHRDKQNQRGYNQAEIIAQQICELGSNEYLPCLTKTTYTQSQASVSDKSIRNSNAKNVYTLKEDCLEKIIGKTILIIDDVCTTGNTLNECARILKKHGAQSVVGLVLTHKTT